MKIKIDNRQIFANVLTIFLLVFIINLALITVMPNLQRSNILTKALRNTDSVKQMTSIRDPTKLANGDFEENDFGSITYWSDTSVDLNRWYLTQVAAEDGFVRWAEPTNLSVSLGNASGVGVYSLDQADCESNCDTSILQLVSAQPNVNYKLAAQALRMTGQGGTLYLDFLDKNKYRIKVKTAGGFAQNAWSQSEVSDTSPDGTHFIRVILYSSNTDQGEIFWDNVTLEKI